MRHVIRGLVRVPVSAFALAIASSVFAGPGPEQGTPWTGEKPVIETVAQIMAATEWQAHTGRGTVAGAFKKKLGLAITSEKPEGGERVYRLA